MSATITYTGYPSIRARNPQRNHKRPEKLDITEYSDWKGYWKAACISLMSCGYKRSTLTLYRQIVRALARHVKKPPSWITPQDLHRFLESMGRDTCTWHWTAMNISVVRTMFDKLGGMNALATWQGPKRKRVRLEILSREQVLDIISKAPTLRDQLMISLLYGCGLKTGELQGLKWEDIDPESGVLRVKSRYSGEYRKLHLPSSVIPILKSGKHRCKAEDLVFQGARPDKCISARAIQLVIRNAARAAFESREGSKPSAFPCIEVTPTVLRNSFAVHFLEDGGNVRELQVALDHQWVETTSRYLPLVDHSVSRSTTEEDQKAPDKPAWPSILEWDDSLNAGTVSFATRLKSGICDRFLSIRRYFNSR